MSKKFKFFFILTIFCVAPILPISFAEEAVPPSTIQPPAPVTDPTMTPDPSPPSTPVPSGSLVDTMAPPTLSQEDSSPRSEPTLTAEQYEEARKILFKKENILSARIVGVEEEIITVTTRIKGEAKGTYSIDSYRVFVFVLNDIIYGPVQAKDEETSFLVGTYYREYAEYVVRVSTKEVRLGEASPLIPITISRGMRMLGSDDEYQFTCDAVYYGSSGPGTSPVRCINRRKEAAP